MKINDQPIRQFLTFWRRIKPEERPEASASWEEATRAAIERLPDGVLDVLIEDSYRTYDEIEAARGSATARASALLVVVAVLNGLAALTATTLSGAHPILATAYVGVVLVLGFFAVGTAVLAIRAQQVATWNRPHVRPADIAGSRHHRLLRAFDVYVASRLNRHGLREVVGYLRDAQAYALITIFLLATLTVVAAATAATKPSNQEAVGTPTQSPIVGPTPAGSETPSPTLVSSPGITSALSAPAASHRPAPTSSAANPSAP